MVEARAPGDGTVYLERFMETGQEIVRNFEKALGAEHGWQGAGFGADFGTGFGWLHAVPEPMARMAALQRQYFDEMGRLWSAALLPGSAAEQAVAEPAKGDRRFKGEAWRETPFYDLMKQSYLIGARFLHDFVEEADVDSKTKMQLRFYARQFSDAMSPSNFPATNPEVIQKAIETRCVSLTDGMKNLIEDIQKGRITRVDEAAFEVGGNLATTPGAVVFENELIQLIEYSPKTEMVEKTPLLMVPPCINKFYLLDLGAGNSLVEYAVAQGHRVFLISWRSAVAETEKLTWDDYLALGPIKAVDVVRDITGQDKTHVLGFCVGGTILGCAAGVLAARGEDKLASITLLTTMLNFSDTGEIGILIDEPYVAMREATIGKGGILPGKELSFTFGTLRANDLIWRYVVDNYLKGATPDAFDLLYWDSDCVSLPGPMYCWYTRNTYLDNAIKDPGRTVQCGVPVDLSKIKAPTYLLASREDHIVPWRTAFGTRNLVGGDVRFVLAASGHVAGVINPPARKKRSHWLNDTVGDTADAWLDKAVEHPGSWWDDWDAWLKAKSTGTVAAPKKPGNARYKPIEPAPGRYVKTKSNL
jgi:polyhydroxyalkanoate synthase subunit PhaC